jgi:hypothetical protein
MAARETRARLVAAGDSDLCPLPQGQLAAGECAAALEAVWPGAHALHPVVRAGPPGQPELLAEGYESPVALRQQGDGKMESGTERRLRGRAVRQAQAAETALRARVAPALAQLEALHQRGRGKQCVEAVSPFRQAAGAMVPREDVEELVGCRLTQPVTPRAGRAYRGQPARSEAERQATLEVCVAAGAWEAAVRRLGWRVYGTQQPGASLALAQAGLASRSEDQVERRLGRLTGRPRSLTPRYVQRDDPATGLLRWLSIAWRVLTLVECVGRRQ